MPVIWLDSARHHPVTGRWSLLGYDPWLRVVARGDRVEVRTSASTQLWRGHPLETLRQVWRQHQVPRSDTPVRRAVGLMGWLSYDLNRWIERLPPPQPSGMPVPELAWFGMRVVLLIDHIDQRSWLLSTVDPHRPAVVARREAREAMEQAEARLAWDTTRREQPGETSPGAALDVAAFLPSLQATTTAAEFQTMVLRALEYIRSGEIFQANVSQRFTAPWHRQPFALYRRLRRLNPSPFACFLSCEDVSVVSCSPERLVLVDEGRVRTRPIAGTRPRGQTAQDDAVNSLELLLSEKERAEHLMLVDLARNDLGRVSRVGSVSVDELMTLEAYSHVIHIVSDISGMLRPGVDPVDVIRAVFPGGTITGCPKVRCMQILRELEPVARGLYTGSIGYLGFDGTMDLNIAIRTIVLQEDELSFHVGAGIVADSDPLREYEETLAKAGALMSALAIDDLPQDVHAHPR
jgi:para-aminobenzoate synthetase component 1